MIAVRFFTVIAGCVLSCALAGQQEPAGSSPAYILGPNDQISIQVMELPEIPAKPYRVDSDGSLDLPLAGRVRAGGLTLEQFKSVLETRLRTQVKNPHVTASLVESKSQPVSVMGAVNTPGTQQLDGSKTLFDVIANAGGLKTDAGDTITVTRQAGEGPLNLPNTVIDPSTGKATAQVSVRDLVELRSPAVNIALRPHDEVSVAAARVLYVIGSVRKPGGFTLSGKRPMSTLEALSLAEGLGPNAAPKNARILRRTTDAELTRTQIKVNLKRVLDGKSEDLQMLPEDILFIPDSSAKKFAGRAAETALATISGVIIWRGL